MQAISLASTNFKTMKRFIQLVVPILMLGTSFVYAQNANEKTEIEQITTTLRDYIEGSTNGQPDRLKNAFHPDLNLYYVRDDEIKIWSGQDYIADTKEGEPTGEFGKIISIDYENDIAVAKVQIAHPESKTPYIDYFMLAKAKGRWTIVHKMFTKRVNK